MKLKNEDSVIIVYRHYPNDKVLNGNYIIRCDDCKHEVVVAPVTKDKQGRLNWVILCHECFVNAEKPEEVTMVGTIHRNDKVLPQREN